MAPRGRPTVRIKLSADERTTLERWARRHSSTKALAYGAGSSWPVQKVAPIGTCRVSWVSIRSRCRSGVHRFAVDRPDGLVDAPVRGRHARSAMTSSKLSWWTPWKPLPPTPRIGRSVDWLPSTASAIRQQPRSGGRSGSSRGGRAPPRSRRTLSWWRRSATSSASTSILLWPPPWSPSTRSHRSRRSTGRLRRCPRLLPERPMTTSATAPATCSPPLIHDCLLPDQARSLHRASGSQRQPGIARRATVSRSILFPRHRQVRTPIY